jgi:hypothetical protein
MKISIINYHIIFTFNLLFFVYLLIDLKYLSFRHFKIFAKIYIIFIQESEKFSFINDFSFRLWFLINLWILIVAYRTLIEVSVFINDFLLNLVPTIINPLSSLWKEELDIAGSNEFILLCCIIAEDSPKIKLPHFFNGFIEF